MSKPKIITLQRRQNEFSFLGKENIITESSDFGDIWASFFKLGGYSQILPYATDTKPINVWYTNSEGQMVYFQGLMVGKVDTIPDGYKLVNFPAGDFIIVTTEWMATNEEAVGENGNGQCNEYAKGVQIPDGYVRFDGVGSPITLIEKENTDAPNGSRYEVWVPIKKVD